MALVMALGSDWKGLSDLHRAGQLIYEGMNQGLIEVVVATKEIPFENMPNVLCSKL